MLLTSCLTLNRKARDNLPPTANIDVASKLVGPLATVTLDGGGSFDPEEQTLSYRWVQASGDLVVIDDASAPQITFVAPERAQSMVFSLIVSDGRFDSAAASVQLRVTTNAAPTAIIAPLGVAIAGTTLALDGTASLDPEAQPLTYTWTAPPGVIFTPSATVASPSITVPSAQGTTLTLSLTVSDGELSNTAQVNVFIQPGDATAVFVDAQTTCGTSCDGTRANPFVQISEAVAASQAQGKPILVAPGFYASFAVSAGVTIIGKCNRATWECGVTNEPSIIASEDNEQWAVSVTSTEPVVLRHLHLLGTSGQLPTLSPIVVAGEGGPYLGALRCQACSVTVDQCYLEANGAGANPGQGTRVVRVDESGLPVRILDSTIVMGRGGDNAGVFASASTDIELHGVTVRSKPDQRDGLPISGYRNVLIFVRGAGVWLNRSRLESDGGPEIRYQQAVTLIAGAGQMPSFLATSNVFWHKGFAGDWPGDLGRPGNTPRRWAGNTFANVVNATRATFVNNTFIGNAAAQTANCETLALDEGCQGLSAVFVENQAPVELINNYFTTLYTLAWSFQGRTVSFLNNTINDVTVLSDGPNVGPTGSVAVLNEGHFEGGQYGAPTQLGEGNVIGNCLLANPASGDAHLQPGSPCIDAGGFDRDAPSVDLDGQSRPAGAAIDRGADEVVP